MANKTWDIQLDGTQHTVELEHGFFSGKRCIKLDGEIIEESKMVIDKGSEHPFKINNHFCVVVIKVKVLFHFDLIVDGVSVETGKKETSSSLSKKQPFSWLLIIFTFLCQMPGIFAVLNIIIDDLISFEAGIVPILTSIIGTYLSQYILKKSTMKLFINVSICLIIAIICWSVLIIYLP